MSKYEPKFTEQEIAAEEYIKGFLMSNGIDPKKPANMQKTFLLGIYNGFVIANAMQMSGDPMGILRIISILKIHFAAKEREIAVFNKSLE